MSRGRVTAGIIGTLILGASLVGGRSEGRNGQVSEVRELSPEVRNRLNYDLARYYMDLGHSARLSGNYREAAGHYEDVIEMLDENEPSHRIKLEIAKDRLNLCRGKSER